RSGVQDLCAGAACIFSRYIHPLFETYEFPVPIGFNLNARTVVDGCTRLRPRPIIPREIEGPEWDLAAATDAGGGSSFIRNERLVIVKHPRVQGRSIVEHSLLENRRCGG